MSLQVMHGLTREMSRCRLNVDGAGEASTWVSNTNPRAHTRNTCLVTSFSLLGHAKPQVLLMTTLACRLGSVIGILLDKAEIA